MVAKPIAKEFVRYTNVRGRVLDPIQMNRCEPGVIHLLRHLFLNVMESLLPDSIDAHNPIIFLYTGLYTPVDNNILRSTFFGQTAINRSLIIMSLRDLSNGPSLFQSHTQVIPCDPPTIPEEIPRVIRKDLSIIPPTFQQYSYSPHYTQTLLLLRLLRLSFSLKQDNQKSEYDNL